MTDRTDLTMTISRPLRLITTTRRLCQAVMVVTMEVTMEVTLGSPLLGTLALLIPTMKVPLD